jgi:PGF-CTERM protein
MRQDSRGTVFRLCLLGLALLAVCGPFVGGAAGQTGVTVPDCGAVSYDGVGSESTPYEIKTVEQLQCMQAALNASYVLTDDIDASATAAWNDGAGFRPIGGNESGSGPAFTGTLDGDGHVIANLTIDRPERNATGLIGNATVGVSVTNITLQNASVTGLSSVGTLLGVGNATVRGARVTGRVNGTFGVGGIAGGINGTVADSASAVSIGNGTFAGGLVGLNLGVINRSYATGHINGTALVGGLAGVSGGVVTRSIATGRVEGETVVGGLVGLTNGTVNRSAATGNVSGLNGVGGLAGASENTVDRTYATGTVSAGINVGGLVGFNVGTVTRSYATGRVDGSLFDGGLVGDDNDTGTAARSYWDTNTTGQNSSDGGTGLTTAEMTGVAPREHMDFDFSGVWSVQTGDYPELRGLPQPANLSETIEFDPAQDDSENANEGVDPPQNGTDTGQETKSGNESDAGNGSSDGSGPGFGVAGALAALGAGSLLRRRVVTHRG